MVDKITKQGFKNSIKNNEVMTYGYASKGLILDFIKNNHNFKAGISPIKRTQLSHFGSNWKNIDLIKYKGYVIAIFNDTNNAGIYKVKRTE